MKGCLVIIYTQVKKLKSEEVNKDSIIKCIFFVIHKSMSTCMILFYVHGPFPLHIGCLETVQMNNQAIIYFNNLWSKEVPINISYPITFNSIDGYLGAIISPDSVIYIITRNKNVAQKEDNKWKSRGWFS